MSHWKEHTKDCKAQLGNGWEVVHLWLDEYAKIYWPYKIHRVHRHHLEGVNEIKEKWGEEAKKAAEIHILKDEGVILSQEDMNKRYSVDPESDKAKVARENGLDL